MIVIIYFLKLFYKYDVVKMILLTTFVLAYLTKRQFDEIKIDLSPTPQPLPQPLSYEERGERQGEGLQTLNLSL